MLDCRKKTNMNNNYFNNNIDWTLDDKMYLKNKDYYKPDWTPLRMKEGVVSKKEAYKSKCFYYDEWVNNMEKADNYIMRKLSTPDEWREWINLYGERLDIYRASISQLHKNNKKYIRWSTI